MLFMRKTIHSAVDKWKDDGDDREAAYGWIFLHTNLWSLVIYKFLLQVKRVFFFPPRLIKLLMIKQWCYKMLFRAFLTLHLSVFLDMYQYVLLNKYLTRLVSNVESSEILDGWLFFTVLDTVSTTIWGWLLWGFSR